MSESDVGVDCSMCGGVIRFRECGINGCDYPIAGECENCGPLVIHGCPDHDWEP